MSDVKRKTRAIFTEFSMNKSNMLDIKVLKYYLKGIKKLFWTLLCDSMPFKINYEKLQQSVC